MSIARVRIGKVRVPSIYRVDGYANIRIVVENGEETWARFDLNGSVMSLGEVGYVFDNEWVRTS